MPAFQQKAAIQFGIVSIPVRAKAAIKTESLGLQMLHACTPGADGEQVYGQAGYSQDWACKGCGEKIGRGDTIKGWKGIPVDADVLASYKQDRSATIDLDRLVPIEQVDPRYFEQSYDVTPEEGAERAYKMFVLALEQTGRVAIGKTVMQDRENIVVLRPRDGVLSLELMYWPEDLARAGRDQAAREAVAKAVVSDAEVAMGVQLAATMFGDFDPSLYTNEYAGRVKAYLESLESGEAAPAAPIVKSQPAGLDLMAALSASINAAEAAKVGVPAQAAKAS